MLNVGDKAFIMAKRHITKYEMYDTDPELLDFGMVVDIDRESNLVTLNFDGTIRKVVLNSVESFSDYTQRASMIGKHMQINANKVKFMDEARNKK